MHLSNETCLRITLLDLVETMADPADLAIHLLSLVSTWMVDKESPAPLEVSAGVFSANIEILLVTIVDDQYKQ